MRYYDIKINNPNTGALLYRMTSHWRGIMSPPDPGSLQVEMDILQYPQHVPGGNSYLRIWGISLELAKLAPKFNWAAISVSGGMGKGLPLANPAQAGLLVSGQVQQCFTNWIGTAMTMDMYLVGVQTPAQTAALQQNLQPPDANISVGWPAGIPLASGIASTLSVAYPNWKVSVNISPNLVLGHTESGFYQSLTQFATWLNSLTADIIGGTYKGVSIAAQNGVLKVFDSTTPGGVKQIAFNDLIGQPTWFAPLTVNVPMVMRGDLTIGQIIKLPTPTLVQTQAASMSQYIKNSTAMQGEFQITQLRHVGNFRQPDGQAWTTAAWAVAQSA